MIFRYVLPVLLTADRQVIAVYKIHRRSIRNPFKESALFRIGKRIPPHMRNLQGSVLIRDPYNRSGKKSKPRYARRFFTVLKKKLKPEADAKERSPLISSFPQNICKAIRFKTIHRVAKRTDSGKDDMICRQNRFLIPCQYIFISQISTGLLDTHDISGIVITDCNHKSLTLIKLD